MAVPRDTATWFRLLLVTLLVVSEVACDTADHSWRGPVTANLTCYNQITVYVDGASKETNFGWKRSELATQYNVSGAAVIAIKCVRFFRDTGIIGSFDNGLVTDASWKCVSSYYTDWMLVSFNDSSWPQAKEQSDSKHLFVNISPNATLIWSLDTNKRTVYCRRRLGNIALPSSEETDTDPDCSPPEVKIDSLQSDPSLEPTVLSRGLSHNISATFKFNCSVTLMTSFQWRIRNRTAPDNQSILVSTGGLTWNIRKESIEVGSYVVEFRVSLLEERNATVSVYGFFDMLGTVHNLVAVIAGGSHVTREYKTIIPLDASPSYDPLSGTGNYSGMNFTWLCKKTNEYFPPTENVSVISINGKCGKRFGGCFGTGVGRLNSTKRLLQINSSCMTIGESYHIILDITKDERSARFVQVVEIVLDHHPIISIRCKSNCGSKVNPSSRLSLSTNCTGNCPNILTYHWSLYEISGTIHGNASIKQVKNLRDNILTKSSSPGLVLKESTLGQNQQYRFVVSADTTAIATGMRRSNASYEFKTNSPPIGGQCTVAPPSGVALVTIFTFNCTGWEDDDIPLMYKIFYMIEGERYMLAGYGTNSSMAIGLPQGDSANNHDIEIKIDIVDVLGVFHTESLTLKVVPPNEEKAFANMIRSLTIGVDSQMSNLIESGDIGGATQLANAVLLSLESASLTSLDKDDKTKIKESIISSMAAKKPESLETVTQVSTILGQATKDPDEVTLTAQNTTIHILRSMNVVLKSDPDASAESLVRQGGESMVLTLGNVMNAAAKNARVKTDTRTEAKTDSNQEQSKNVAKATAELVSEVGSTLLSRKIVGESPTVIKTSSLSMVLDRQRPTDMNASKLQEGETSFVLPPIDQLLEGHSISVSYLDSQMLSTPFNPYTWDASADDVTSHVVSLAIKDDMGNPLNVSNLRSRIAITIPRTPTSNDTHGGQSYFVKPSKEGKMQHHRINVPLAGTSLTLQINTGPNVSFTAYVRFNSRPTKERFDYRTEVPDYSSCIKGSQGQFTRCLRDPYAINLPSAILERAGTYYVGIKYDGKQKQDVKTRKKRSCFRTKRHKRSCIETKEAPTLLPLNRTLVLVYNPEIDANYTMSVQQSSCLYWSADIQEWTTAGCEATPQSSDKSIHCLCDHLTSFGGNMLVTPNPIDFDTVLLEMSRLDETGNVVVLATILTVLLLYFVVVIFARRADKIDEYKTGPGFFLLPEMKESFQYEIKIRTGVWKNSGTTANVVMVMKGHHVTSEPIVFQRDMAPGRIVLARGSDDTFYVNVAQPIGAIQQLHIWHDNSGQNPSWFLEHVFVREIQTNRVWNFICNRWLSLERGDGKLERTILPTTQEDVKTFKRSFAGKAAQNYVEGHLWLSVITKTPCSTFTRVQRATCCFTLLFYSMLANAMFYKLEATANEAIKVGPFMFSSRQVVVGIQSALLVTPLTFLSVWIFSNTKSRFAEKAFKGNVRDNKMSQRRLFSIKEMQQESSNSGAPSKTNSSEDKALKRKESDSISKLSTTENVLKISDKIQHKKTSSSLINNWHVSFGMYKERPRHHTKNRGSSQRTFKNVLSKNEEIIQLTSISVHGSGGGSSPSVSPRSSSYVADSEHCRQTELSQKTSKEKSTELDDSMSVNYESSELGAAFHSIKENGSDSTTVISSSTARSTLRNKSISVGKVDIKEVNSDSSTSPTETSSDASFTDFLYYQSSTERAINDERFTEDKNDAAGKSGRRKNKKTRLCSIVQLELEGRLQSPQQFSWADEHVVEEQFLNNNQKAIVNSSSVQIQMQENSGNTQKNIELNLDKVEKKLDTAMKDTKHDKSSQPPTDNLKAGPKLPFWVAYIAWLVCFVTVATSASLTFFYSLAWGEQKANEWLSSMLISFLQDLFVTQPAKIFVKIFARVFAVVFVLTLIFKKSPQGKNETPKTADSPESAVKIAKMSQVDIRIPEEEELEESREIRRKERKMHSVGKELITYLVFLFLMLTVCYGNRTDHGFLMIEDLKNSLTGFSKVSSPSGLFSWMRKEFIPGIYAGDWYNGHNEKHEEYIGNKRSLLVGMPRLRQLRVKEGSCEVPSQAKRFTEKCYDFYSFQEEDTTLYNLPGWQPYSDINETNNLRAAQACPKPWRYASRNSIKGLPLWGYFTVYDGGGFVADLGYNNASASSVMNDLIANEWVDQKTRALLLEFAIFNANTNYISICTFFFEILPTGYGNPFTRISSIALYNTESAVYEFWVVCQFFFIALVFYYFVFEVTKFVRQRCSYFKEVWNWVELLQIVSALLGVVCYILKAKSVLDAVITVQQNPFKTVNFQKALIWVEADNLMMSIAVFVATVKLLKLIRFNFEVCTMISSIRISKSDLASYVVVLMSIIIAFALSGNLIFGSTVLRYSSVVKTLASELEMSLGGQTALEELRISNRILGPLFAIGYMLVMAFVFVNIFMAILNESLSCIKQNPALISKEYEIGQLIQEKLLKSSGYHQQQPLSLGHLDQEGKRKISRKRKDLELSSISLQITGSCTMLNDDQDLELNSKLQTVSTSSHLEQRQNGQANNKRNIGKSDNTPFKSISSLEQLDTKDKNCRYCRTSRENLYSPKLEENSMQKHWRLLPSLIDILTDRVERLQF